MKTENLHDSELIHYASLSDDPEKRRLAEIAAKAEPWEKMRADFIGLDSPEAVGTIVGYYHELRNALRDIRALTALGAPDTDHLQYLARLSQAVNDGRVQLVEDCPCTEDGAPGLADCPECKGAGFTTSPADSDSI